MDDIKIRNGRLMFAAAKEKLAAARELREHGFHRDREEADQGITDAASIISAIRSLLENEFAIALEE